MVVNYAFSRALNFLIKERRFYLPYFCTLLMCNIALIPIERSLEKMGFSGTVLTLLIALSSIIIQVALIYSINEKIEKGSELSFLESLWPGLCFTPGFILQSIKMGLLTIVGALFFIFPGVYMLLKHCMDPFYSLISDEGSLFNAESPFTKDQLISVFIMCVSFIPIAFIFNMVPMIMDMFLSFGAAQFLAAPFATLSSMFTGLSLYYYIDYTIRISRKRGN